MKLMAFEFVNGFISPSFDLADLNVLKRQLSRLGLKFTMASAHKLKDLAVELGVKRRYGSSGTDIAGVDDGLGGHAIVVPNIPR